MAKVGTIIGGQYEILKQIGHGGMSTVYLGMGKRLGKNWAIKEAKKGDSNSNAARFFEATPIEEANFLKDLHHKNIVSVTDIIEQDGYTYIVEEYLPGQDLEDKMKAGPSPVKDVVHWGEQVCDALDYLHTRNIIYRDMKPANVRLDAEGDRVILMDFGIAKRYNPQNPADKYKVGTKGYAPQEQFQGMTDQRSDIYSLGITLKALLLGISPYEPAFNDPRSAARIQGENGDGLLRVLNKATNPDPAKRYQTAAAFGKAIKNYEQISTRYKAKLKKQRNTFFGFVIATAVALVAALVFTGVYIGTKDKAIDDLKKASDYSAVSSAFSGILSKKTSNDDNDDKSKSNSNNGETKIKEAKIPYDAQNEKITDAAANIVDLFMGKHGDGKDQTNTSSAKGDVKGLKESLSKYYEWAKPGDYSDNSYAKLIKDIYTKAGRSEETNEAILYFVCCEGASKNNYKELATILKDCSEVIDSSQAYSEFFTQTTKAMNIIDSDNVSRFADVDGKEETKEYIDLNNYISYIDKEIFTKEPDLDQYKDEGLSDVIYILKQASQAKLSDMSKN